MLALLALVIVTAVALSPLHGHGQARPCEVCQTAHMPLVEPAAVAVEQASPLVEIKVVTEIESKPREVARTPRGSRGPPV